MPQRPLSVILIVIGTMAGVVAIYSITLGFICMFSADHDVRLKALDYFKDFGLFAGGALSGFLARTSTHDAPSKTEIVNTPDEPVPTKPQP